MGFETATIRIRARFDGAVFVPVEPVDLPLGTIIEGHPEPVRKRGNPQLGMARGQGKMEPDFDATPEGFEEYL